VSETDRQPDGDPLAGALSLIGRQGRRLDDVERDVGGLKDAVAKAEEELGPRVTELAEIVAALAEDEASGSRAQRTPWWPDFGAGEELTEALRALGVWVEEVIRQRHPELYRGLAPCWYRHPEVLDELTALRTAWFGAYRDSMASATAAIEWHDRWLPACLARCKAVMKSRGCDKEGHDERPMKTEPFLASAEFENFTKADPKRR
jgi:hypothetical protein